MKKYTKLINVTGDRPIKLKFKDKTSFIGYANFKGDGTFKVYNRTFDDKKYHLTVLEKHEIKLNINEEEK